MPPFTLSCMGGLETAGGLLEGVLALERAVSEEIGALAEYRVFPSAELVLIRKEVCVRA